MTLSEAQIAGDTGAVKKYEGKVVGDTLHIQPQAGDQEKARQEWRDALEAGAWDGFDNVKGFDEVAADQFGSMPKPAIALNDTHFVDANFWIDSLYETTGTSPFVWNNVADTTVPLSEYFVMFFGQLEVPTAGSYTLVTSGRFHGTLLWLDKNQNGVFDADETIERDAPEIANYNGSANVPDSLKSGNFSYGSVTRTWTTELAAGKYRIKALYWHHSNQTSNPLMAWKKAGEEISVIPASAFGTRKQMSAIPLPQVSKVVFKGADQTRTDTTHVCLEHSAIYTANLLNAPVGKTLKYQWRLSTSSDWMDLDTADYTLELNTVGRFRPYLRIDYGDYVTRSVQAPYNIQVLGCTPTAKIVSVKVDDTEVTGATEVDGCLEHTITLTGAVEKLIKQDAQLKYAWDFGSDQDTVTDASHSYTLDSTADDASYAIKLRVWADEYSSAQVSSNIAINVKGCPPPVSIASRIKAGVLGVAGSQLFIPGIGQDALVSLYGMDGKLLFNQTFKSTADRVVDFSAEGFKKGLYYVKVQQGAKSLTAKVLIH